MNLSKPTLYELKKVTVKIICDGSEGSGTLLMINDVLYVLTAAHVIKKNDANEPIDKDKICIRIIKNSTEYNFIVEDILLFVYDDGKTDAAVLRISNINNMPTTDLDKMRILSQPVTGSAIFCGFHKESQTPKQYAFERRDEETWAVLEIQLPVQPNQNNNFTGCSGGGIFYKDTDGILYLSAYMTGLGCCNGNNNEFKCPPAIKFCEIPELKPIIEERQFDYVDDSGLAYSIESKTNLKALDKSSYGDNHSETFISSKKLIDIINILRNDDEMTILLTALSGMGKSRLIYEAFKNTGRLPNRYYTKYSENKTDILGEMTTIFRKNSNEDGIIIIDDCPMDFIPELISRRNNENQLFRLIFANHDFFNEELYNNKDYTIIQLTSDDIKDDVDKYITEVLNENEENKNDILEIKKMADGYPQMAIELVKAYKEEKNVTPDTIGHLMPKLLHFTPGQERDEKSIWQTLSLCMPFPYANASHKGFEYMISDNHFTSVGTMDLIERRSIAAQIINKHKPILIDLVGNWLYVRPFPLAVWLTAEWFKNVCNTNAHFEELIDGIKSQPEWVQNSISEGFCKHIQQMHGNKAAFEMVEKLVNQNPNSPFFNEEVLSSGLGSKLFLAMSSVNPTAMAKCLYNVLSPKPVEWIKEHIEGDVRRNLVWALEKLCFNKASYNYACKVMALLAIAENETWGNNASGQFSQLFHILLPGTEADLRERLNILHYLRDNDEEYRGLLLNCVDRAFDDGDFIRSGSANQFGLHKKEDYKPSSNQEIIDYWKECTLILQELLDKDGTTLDRIAKIAVSHVLRWSFNGMLEREFPLLNQIADVKGGIWQEMYNEMNRIGRNRLDFYPKGFLCQLDVFKEQIRPKCFCQKMKDVRQEVYNDYIAPIEEQIQHERELFRQLAVEFIEQGFYKSYDEVKQIAEDKDFYDTFFSLELRNIITDKQISNILAIFLDLISDNGGDMFVSGFVFSFCSVFRNHERVRNFIYEIYERGYHGLFMRLLAHCETAQFDSYQTMRNLYLKGKLEQNAPDTYLENVSIPLNSRWNDIIKMFYKDFPKSSHSLMNFFIRHQFNTEILKDAEVLEIIKNVILEYPIEKTENNPLHEYIRYTTDLLEKYHDEDFAVKINRKIMEILKSQFFHGDLEYIYPVLITQYTDAIWPDLEKAFSNPEYYFFLYQIKNTIGSGSGFGVGPLFAIGDEKIKDLCMKNPQFAPAVIAKMCPIFHSDNTGKETRFHDWVLWLLDQFGDMDNVLSGLHTNMGSYAWTGSIIPLLIQKKNCFGQIQEHQNIKVRKWVEACLQEIEAELSRERNREEYMRLHYT